MYEIKIKKKEMVVKKVIGGWEVLEKRPYTQQEYDDACGPFKDLPDKDLIKHVMGRTPSYDREEEVETLILHQNVEELDLASVIRAVNKLGG